MMSIMSNTNYLQSQIKKVSREEYEEFDRNWAFNALKGLRYGQLFCNKFDIPGGTPLFYFKDVQTCKDWIEHNYLEK